METSRNQNHRAYIIAVVSQKGGPGKTVVDVQLAIKMAQRGMRVCIIDMDEDQYSVAKHLTRRKNNNILPEVPFFIATPENLKNTILKLSKEFEIIFIESTGKITRELRWAISLSDMVLTVIEANDDNIDTIPNLVRTFKELIKEGIKLDKIPAFIIPNKISSQQRENINLNNEDNKLVRMLKLQPQIEFFKFTNTFIKYRPSIYPECYSLGKGVAELEGKEVNRKSPEEGKDAIKKANLEIDNILKEIFNL